MYCKYCGYEIKDDAFCSKCGKPQNEQTAAPEAAIPPKKKSSDAKTIILVMVLVFGGLSILTPMTVGFFKSPNRRPSVSSSAEPRRSATTKKVMSEEEYKAKCRSCNFDEIARDENALSGEYFTFTGEVVQVDGDAYRINVTKSEYGIYTDTIYCTYTYKGGDRILEDDIVTVWGVSRGFKTYTSVLGASITLPNINVKYATIVE